MNLNSKWLNNNHLLFDWYYYIWPCIIELLNGICKGLLWNWIEFNWKATNKFKYDYNEFFQMFQIIYI